MNSFTPNEWALVDALKEKLNQQQNEEDGQTK
jgi:hypothetical protein